SSDAQGHYSFKDVEGSFDLKVSKVGYEERTRHVGAVREDTTIDVAIAPLHRLTGTITEVPPTEQVSIESAKVQVLNGSAEGRSSVTDVAGRFTVYGVSGEFDVRVSRDGYESKSARVSATGSTTTLDIALLPDNGLTRTSVSGRLCPDWAFWFS